jgi:PAS domain S-box-containing protein
MTLALEQAGAGRGLLILLRGDRPRIEAEARTDRETVEVTLRQGTVTPAELPESLLHTVIRTRESVILEDASAPNPFSADEYLRQKRARSILGLPLVKQAKLIGVLYLENNLTPHVFTPARLAVLKLLASQAAISLENARLYTDLRRSEAYLAEAQRLSRTGSFGWSLSGGEIYWSDETYRLVGIDRAIRPTFERVFQRVHPEDRAFVQETLDRAFRDGTDVDFEQRFLMPDGSVKYVRVVAQAVREESGELEYIGAGMDVTEQHRARAVLEEDIARRKRAEEQLQASLEEKEALLKEVHHRVKNNLQLISSLLSLQAARIAEPAVAELFAESRNRVRSMALVHENLYRAGNFARISMATHVQNLCAHLARAYGMNSRRVELASRIGDVQLDLDLAVPCSLIVNELVSNALKHAFPDGRAGRVCVELQPFGDQQHVLVVADDGVGLPPDLDCQRADSLGLQLVDDLTQQLHGTIAVSRDGGTTFTITFDTDRGGERER